MMELLFLTALLLLSGCVTTPSTMLVNSQGQAMRCATTGYGYGIAGAIAISTAGQSHDRCVQDLHKIGYIKIPDVRVGLKSDWKLTPPVVMAVEGPAEQIGLKPGDQILSFDGKVYASEFDVYKLLNTKKLGDTLKVQVRREDAVLDFAPVLTSR
jgi:S1-C subfamily serine protease